MDLLAARGQMAMSLGFHILFAVAGIAMPVLMAVAEWRHLKTGDAMYLELAKRWARGTAILFAVGAVSGTVLSFELGLLWPTFMRHAGPIIGMPFSLEGFAFFLEAIFIGIYLYGWNRMRPRLHLWAGVVVALCGALSGIFVVAVNAWMNAPTGFTLVDGQLTDIHPLQVFASPAFPSQALHMTFAAYAAIGFLAAGIHAWALLRTPGSRFHTLALGIALGMAVVAVPLQLFTGDLAGKHIAEFQPVKLAAAERHFETRADAPITAFGLVEIPYGLSMLAYNDPHAVVRGLEDFPESDWPPITIVHVAFEIMVGCGSAMFGVVLWVIFRVVRKKKVAASRPLLWACVFAAPLGMIAIEAGWTVTEVGRQPWIIHGVMRTAEAVTPMPGLIVPFLTFSILYLVLGVIVVVLLRAHVFAAGDLG
ncbi:MAG: cytochrome ubiquinol oxidase subunit I [Myxococcota bacterium]|nr:cytochrome ubiquinol oxidase subunit I [Myxococcota bacterium]